MNTLNLKEKLKPHPQITIFKKKKFYIITVIGLLIIGGIYYILPKYKSFYDQKYNFSFKYPKAWTEEDLSKSGLEKHLAVRVKDEKTNATFQVRIEELKQESNFNTKELTKQLDEKMLKELENFKKISSRDIRVSEKDALEYVYVYSYKTESGEAKITEQKMIILASGNKAYYLIGQAKEGDFSKVEKNFDQIIKSFKLI